MITVPGSFADARIRTSGEAGRRWIASLPDLVTRLCGRWTVELDMAARPRTGDRALVLFGRRRGEPCALKVSWPDLWGRKTRRERVAPASGIIRGRCSSTCASSWASSERSRALAAMWLLRTSCCASSSWC